MQPEFTKREWNPSAKQQALNDGVRKRGMGSTGFLKINELIDNLIHSFSPYYKIN
jgi:hypothetical protein